MRVQRVSSKAKPSSPSASRHEHRHLSHPAVRRPAARHVGPAQEGRACSSSRTTSRTSSSRSSTRCPDCARAARSCVGGDGRFHNRRRDPDHPAHGGGERLRPRAGRARRHPVDAGGELRRSASAARSAASSCRRATTRAAPTATSASSTTSPTAARRRRRSPTRSARAAQTIDALPHASDAPTVDLDRDRRARASGRRRSRSSIRSPTTPTLMGDAVRLRRDPRGCSRGGFRMRFDAMHAVTGPYARGDPRAAARRAGRQRRQRRRRCPTSAAAIPTRTRSTPRDLMAAMFGADAPDFGAATRRRRRPQHDRRPRASSSRRRDSLARARGATRSSCPATRAGLAGIARSMPTEPRRRPRRRGARHRLLRDADRLEVLRQPARRRPRRRSAARRASAPAPTTCARRTACGRCCSGSTCSRARGESVEQIVRDALARASAATIYSRHDYEGDRQRRRRRR